MPSTRKPDWTGCKWETSPAYIVGMAISVMRRFLMCAITIISRSKSKESESFGNGIEAMGAGLAILANSRPYEGALFALPVMAALIWLIHVRARGLAILAPLLLVLGATALLMGAYFVRVTGSPFRLAYEFYRATFTVAPHFIWQSPRPEPVYHQRVLREFHTRWEMACYSAARAIRSPYGILDKAKTYWRFYLGPFLTLPFLTLPWLWRRLRTRLLLLAGILFSLGLAVEVWHAPHYAAPAMGLSLLLVTQALRQLRQIAGAFAVRAVVLAAVLP